MSITILMDSLFCLSNLYFMVFYSLADTQHLSPFLNCTSAFCSTHQVVPWLNTNNSLSTHFSLALEQLKVGREKHLFMKIFHILLVFFSSSWRGFNDIPALTLASYLHCSRGDVTLFIWGTKRGHWEYVPHPPWHLTACRSSPSYVLCCCEGGLTLGGRLQFSKTDVYWVGRSV